VARSTILEYLSIGDCLEFGAWSLGFGECTHPTKALGFGPVMKLTAEKAKAASAKTILSFNPNLVTALSRPLPK
jgi:hypothetical protein